MHYQYITLPTMLVVSCFFAQSVQGQYPSDALLWQNQFNHASAQISSARNYDLLRPIASRPKPSTSGMLQPKAPLQPLQPLATNRPANNNPVANAKVAVGTPPKSTGILIPMTQAASTPVSMTLPVTVTNASRLSTTPSPTPRTTGEEKQSYSIKVSPHSFQSGNLDRYEFRIHNPAPHALSYARVKLTAPKGSHVAQVIPKPESVAGEEIVFEIGELAPGGQQIVEVLIENPRDELVQFESSIVSQTWGGKQVADSGVYDDQIINRELRLVPLAGMRLLEPIGLDRQASVDTERRELEREQAEIPLDEVLQSEYEKSFAENVKRKSLESFPLTPETASETKQFGRVASLLSGPLEVTVGEEVEYVVSLKNETTQTADSLIVQLSVPDDFKITLLDRAAWYDAEGGKISWKVPPIEGQTVETIRYRGVARSAGLVKQGVVVGMGNELQGFCTFKTQVR